MPGSRLVEDPEKRARWQKARGKGGFRRLRLGYGGGTDLRQLHLHHSEIRSGPDRGILADSRDVDDQLCVGRADAATNGRRVAIVLRLVFRSAAGVARGLG